MIARPNPSRQWDIVYPVTFKITPMSLSDNPQCHLSFRLTRDHFQSSNWIDKTITIQRPRWDDCQHRLCEANTFSAVQDLQSLLHDHYTGRETLVITLWWASVHDRIRSTLFGNWHLPITKVLTPSSPKYHLMATCFPQQEASPKRILSSAHRCLPPAAYDLLSTQISWQCWILFPFQSGMGGHPQIPFSG